MMLRIDNVPRAFRRTARFLAALLATAVLTAVFAQEFPLGYIGQVSVEPSTAHVGDEITLSGSGFVAGDTLDFVRLTYDVTWDLDKADGLYKGIDVSDRLEPFGSATVDADGAFEATLVVPEDYGGMQTILVQTDGTNLNQAGIYVATTFELSPESGPIGTDITVTVTGVDAGQPMAYYQLTYDNHITGFYSAVNTGGTAEFVIPATGNPGPHLIRVEDAPFGHPYMPLDTSPWAILEVDGRTFTVTDGDPILPPPVGEQVLASVAGVEPMGDGPQMWLDPAEAAVGTPVVLHGKGFEGGDTLELVMSNMKGSRVTTSGFAPIRETMGVIDVEADGTFAMEMAMPDTLGGYHDFGALKVDSMGDETLVASTEFRVRPMMFELEKTQWSYGEEIRLHLKGIGWTQTENIFAVVVDNTYIGYGCGFSTNGDVDLPIWVAFEPGIHYIDIYPSFYRNKEYSEIDEAPFLFRQGLLSWQDHPSGFHFRVAIEVLPPETATAETP